MTNYDDLINQFVGFLFHCSNGELSEPDSLSDVEVARQPSGTGNSDCIFIYCEKCGCNMDFTPGDPTELDGKWRCPKCGQAVREEEPYDILEEINQAFEKGLYSDD